jgi:hypothetical protein
MSLDRFQGLVRDFGAGVGIPEMTADDEGYVAISFDARTIHLQYERDADRIVAFTNLGEAEVDRLVEIYSMLLAANMFWQGTNGATFSVEPDTGMVFLADRRAQTTLDTRGLNDWLEGFINITEYWAGRLALANSGGPLGDDPPPGGDGSPDAGQRFIVRG